MIIYTVLCKSNAYEIRDILAKFSSKRNTVDISEHLLFSLLRDFVQSQVKYRFCSAKFRSRQAKYRSQQAIYRCWSAKNRLRSTKFCYHTATYRYHSETADSVHCIHQRSQNIVSDEPKTGKFTVPQSETSRFKQVYMKVISEIHPLFSQ